MSWWVRRLCCSSLFEESLSDLKNQHQILTFIWVCFEPLVSEKTNMQLSQNRGLNKLRFLMKDKKREMWVGRSYGAIFPNEEAQMSGVFLSLVSLVFLVVSTCIENSAFWNLLLSWLEHLSVKYTTISATKLAMYVGYFYLNK